MMQNEVPYDKPENIYSNRGELLGKGNDFEVFEFSETHVVKYPNRERQSHRPYDNMSLGFYIQLKQDHETLQEIFGNSLAESSFFPPNESEHANYRIVQQKFEKNEFLNALTEEGLASFIVIHKDAFKDLLEKAKKAQEVFLVPLDLTPNNIVYHEDRLIFVENDRPTVRAQHKEELASKIEKDQRTLDKIEEIITRTN